MPSIAARQFPSHSLSLSRSRICISSKELPSIECEQAAQGNHLRSESSQHTFVRSQVETWDSSRSKNVNQILESLDGS